MSLNNKQIEIIKIAEKLFAENGYEGTSVRAIAEAAGINVAMISYYFGGKRNLLKLLTLYRSHDFETELTHLLTQKHDYFEKIDLIIAYTIKRLHENRRVHKIANFEYAKAEGSEDFTHFTDQRRKNYRLIENYIKQGQQAGIFSKNINIPLIITTISGTYFGFYYNKKLFSAIHNISQEQSVDEFVEEELIPHLQRSIKAILTYEN